MITVFPDVLQCQDDDAMSELLLATLVLGVAVAMLAGRA
jgi:hypothetical protein